MIDCLQHIISSVEITQDTLCVMMDMIDSYVERHNVDSSLFIRQECNDVVVTVEYLPYNLLCLLFKFFMTLSEFSSFEVNDAERQV